MDFRGIYIRDGARRMLLDKSSGDGEGMRHFLLHLAKHMLSKELWIVVGVIGLVWEVVHIL